MRNRVWVTVFVSALVLVFASSARPLIIGLFERVAILPWPIVVMGVVSLLMLLVSLAQLYRTWVVRKSLVRVLARFGIPDSDIARRVNLPQDGVTLLRAVSCGNHDFSGQEVFAASGTQLTRSPS